MLLTQGWITQGFHTLLPVCLTLTKTVMFSLVLSCLCSCPFPALQLHPPPLTLSASPQRLLLPFSGHMRAQQLLPFCSRPTTPWASRASSLSLSSPTFSGAVLPGCPSCPLVSWSLLPCQPRSVRALWELPEPEMRWPGPWGGPSGICGCPRGSTRAGTRPSKPLGQVTALLWPG